MSIFEPVILPTPFAVKGLGVAMRETLLGDAQGITNTGSEVNIFKAPGSSRWKLSEPEPLNTLDVLNTHVGAELPGTLASKTDMEI